jgi:hypothetical protein
VLDGIECHRLVEEFLQRADPILDLPAESLRVEPERPAEPDGIRIGHSDQLAERIDQLAEEKPRARPILLVCPLWFDRVPEGGQVPFDPLDPLPDFRGRSVIATRTTRRR